MTMVLHSLHPPTKWQAGTSGGKPFYFACCKCGAEDAVIAGICAANVERPTFHDIGIMKGDQPCQFRPAMYCVACWPAELEAGRRRMEESHG